MKLRISKGYLANEVTLCAKKYVELGCTCYVPDEYLGDIITEDPNCKYHNWLDKHYEETKRE